MKVGEYIQPNNAEELVALIGKGLPNDFGAGCLLGTNKAVEISVFAVGSRVVPTVTATLNGLPGKYEGIACVPTGACIWTYAGRGYAYELKTPSGEFIWCSCFTIIHPWEVAKLKTLPAPSNRDFWEEFLRSHPDYPRVIDKDGHVLVDLKSHYSRFEEGFVAVDDPNI